MSMGIRDLIKAIVPGSIRSSRLGKLVAHVTRSHDAVYDQYYYDSDVEVTSVQSAAIMAKSIVERFKPRTIIDVGCGTGALLDAFRKLNCDVYGLEYSESGLAYCKRRQLPVRKFDIEKDQIDTAQYDLAVSFEVAEHLPPWIADRFVGLLCKASPLVIISAATPGQGGKDHVNEQPHAYWMEKFDRYGYFYDEGNSARLSAGWKLAGTAPWYSENVMVFVRRT